MKQDRTGLPAFYKTVFQASKAASTIVGTDQELS